MRLLLPEVMDLIKLHLAFNDQHVNDARVGDLRKPVSVSTSEKSLRTPLWGNLRMA